MISQKTVLLFFLLFLMFFVKAVLFLDPDLGWHLRMGEIISETRAIPKTDIFSYTMPEFKFVDHEWFADLATYKIYSLFGKYGLALIYAIFFLITLNIVLNLKFLKTGEHPPGQKIFMTGLIVASGTLLSQFGVRPQAFSWMFFAALLYFLSNFTRGNKYKMFIPLLFWVWANMHGSFVLGLFMFGVFTFARGVILRKNIIRELPVFIVAVLITFVNPYGLNLWKEAFDTFLSSALRLYIEEWGPAWTTINLGYLFLTASSVALLLRYKNFFMEEFIAVYLLLLVMSFLSIVNIPIFALCATPVFLGGLSRLGEEAKTVKGSVIRLRIFLTGLFILSLLLFIADSYRVFDRTIAISEENFYPKDAVNFLNKNISSGEIFSHYNWGGYLIWKIPEKKVFIDGRMGRWPGVVEYQRSIINGKLDYRTEFKKYAIDTVLLPRKMEDTDLVNRMENDNWIVVYEDEISKIWRKQL